MKKRHMRCQQMAQNHRAALVKLCGALCAACSMLFASGLASNAAKKIVPILPLGARIIRSGNLAEMRGRYLATFIPHN